MYVNNLFVFSFVSHFTYFHKKITAYLNKVLFINANNNIYCIICIIVILLILNMLQFNNNYKLFHSTLEAQTEFVVGTNKMC